MFKVGYLRSSYNDGGINHVLRNTIGKDLYHVFFGDEKQNAYVIKPDWPTCLRRAIEVRDGLARHVEENGAYFVQDAEIVTAYADRPHGEQEALAAFMKKKRERASAPAGSFDSFSCREGEFHLGDPLRVAALIPGTKRHWSGNDVPCLFVVYHAEDGLKWYRQATEIVVEMIEWVMSQPNPSQFCLHWSA
jgi:hypothetical protein